MESIGKEKVDKLVTVEDAWKRVFTNLTNNRKIISTQLNEIKKGFPELADTFEYLMGYIGFLTNRMRMREVRFQPGDIPKPEPPDVPSAADLICDFFGETSRDCLCARGNFSYCETNGSGVGGISDELIEFITCNGLKKKLTENLGHICQIYERNKDMSNYSQREFNSIRRYVNEISDIQAQLIEQGCFKFEILPEYITRKYIELRPL